ncbi:MAG: sigma-70 family RNA polymerase sigma factor [Planctomycetes bacterium]|nr:sigma-70 family RNA polymerase sigma factor [Planctomycetota bacterium]
MAVHPDPESLLLHEGFVRALARAILGDENRVDDAVQQTWLAAMQSRDSRPRTLRAWLATLVRNVARDSLRRDSARNRREHDAARPESVPSMAEILEREEARRDMVDAVARLEPPYRDVILLKYFEGLPPRAIARKLDLPVETVRTRQKRALELIRAELAARRGGARNAADALLPIAALGVAKSNLTMFPGLMIMTTKSKLLIASAIILFFAGLCLFYYNYGGGSAADANVNNTAAAPIAALSTSKPAIAAASVPATTESRRVEAPAQPESAPESRTANFGSLMMHVRYFDDSPAARIGVGWSRFADRDKGKVYNKHEFTDANGDVQFQQLPPGDVSLWFDCARSRRATIDAGKTKEMTIKLPQGYDLDGKVIDKSGAPFPNATIYFWSINSLDADWPVATSGADGTFHLRQIDIAFDYHAFAAALGFAPSVAVRLDAQKGTTLSLTLQITDPGASLAGRVHDDKGDPIAGAVIKSGRADYRNPPVMSNGTVGFYAVVPDATSDANGKFTLQSVPAGQREIFVARSGFGLFKDTISVASESNASLDITLQKEVILAGTVRDGGGSPVADCQIEINGARGPDGFLDFTKKDGTFRIVGLPSTMLDAVAFAPKLGRISAKLQGAPGEEVHWNPIIDAGIALVGRVVDEKGAPQANCTIFAQPSDYNSKANLHGGQARTNDAGEFKLSGCPAEPMKVRVGSPPYGAITVKTIEGVCADAGELIITIPKIDVSGKIRGRLVDSQSNPIANASVLAYRRGSSGIQNAHEIAADGTFEIVDIVPGDYYLDIKAPNVGIYKSGVRHVNTHETCDFGVIKIEQPGTLVVHPRVKGDARVNNLGMSTMNRERLSGIGIQMDNSGDFRASLEPGKYQILYEDWRSVGATAARVLDVEIHSGEETSAEFEVARGAAREFKLTYPKDATPPEDSAEYLRMVITNRSGATCYDNIQRFEMNFGYYLARAAFAPGNYHFEATESAGYSASGDFEISDANAKIAAVAVELLKK